MLKPYHEYIYRCSTRGNLFKHLQIRFSVRDYIGDFEKKTYVTGIPVNPVSNHTEEIKENLTIFENFKNFLFLASLFERSKISRSIENGKNLIMSIFTGVPLEEICSNISKFGFWFGIQKEFWRKNILHWNPSKSFINKQSHWEIEYVIFFKIPDIIPNQKPNLEVFEEISSSGTPVNILMIRFLAFSTEREIWDLSNKLAKNWKFSKFSKLWDFPWFPQCDCLKDFTGIPVTYVTFSKSPI